MFTDQPSDGPVHDPTGSAASASEARLPDSALLRALGLPATGEALEAPTLAAALSAVQASPDNVPEGPLALFELAAQDLDLPSSEVPQMEPSPNLVSAVSAFSHVLGLGPLTSDEHAALEALPPVVAPGLTPLVDAMTLAIHLQRQATEAVSMEERGFLIASAPSLLAGTADKQTVARAEDISSRIDLSKSVQAARVLLEAVEEASPLLEEAADVLRAQAEDATARASAHTSDGADSTLSDSQVLSGVSGLLRRQAGADAARVEGAPPAVQLPEAMERLTALFGGDVPGDAAATAASLPPDLSSALGRIVAAYASTYEVRLGDTGPAIPVTTAESAARVIDAIDASLPTLKRWSWLLQQAPSATAMLTPERANADAAGLAAQALRSGTSATGALRLAGLRAGHDVAVPVWLDADGPPAPGIAMNAWYDAFRPDVDADTRAEAVSGLERLPADVREATLLLVWSQVQADRIARAALPSAERLAKLENVDLAITAAIAGTALTPELASTLEEQVRLRDQMVKGLYLEPALALADATDRVGDLLGPRKADRSNRPGPVTALANHDPLPGSHPPGDVPGVDPEEILGDLLNDDGGAHPPSNPALDAPPGATDSRRDIWFADPTGAVVVTGFKSTTHPAGHIAVLLDLGGNDVYLNNAGGAAAERERRYAVHVDLGGNDNYNTTVPFGQGAARGSVLEDADGVLGAAPVGVLVDASGNDRYRGGPFSQGAVFGGGVGLLVDNEGDDRYVVEGEWTPSNILYDLSGGQGYAAQGIDDPGQAYLASFGIIIEGGGSDSYSTLNGLGGGIVFYNEDAQETMRHATGIMAEMGGDDTYECKGNVCLGLGRWADDQALLETCPPCGPMVNLQTVALFLGTDVQDLGVRAASGIFLDTSGNDGYPEQRGRDDASSTRAHSRVGVTISTSNSGADLAANQSIFLDVALGDADGDGYPDPVETIAGHSPGDASDNPHANLIRELALDELAFGGDSDGDCWSDESERRLGTSPGRNESRPSDHPDSSCRKPSNGMLVDVSVDLTTGLGPTSSNRSMRVPGLLGDSYEALFQGAAEALFEGGAIAPTPLGGGLGTDGIIVPLLGIGDTTPTVYTKPYLITIDLGGDDRYRAPVGSAQNPLEDRIPDAFDQFLDSDPTADASTGTPDDIGERDDHVPAGFALSAVALDIAGDDRYTGLEGDSAFGVGLGGAFGVLVDAIGTDSYEVDMGLGVALGPSSVGVLIDLGDDDQRRASSAFSLGYTLPSCEGLQVVAPVAQCLRTPDQFLISAPTENPQNVTFGGFAGPAIALVVDAQGDDWTRGPRQGVLDSPGEDPGTIDISLSSQNPPTTSPPPENTRSMQDLAAFMDLAGADIYVLTDPNAIEDPHRFQGFALRPPEVDGQVQGRNRGAAAFVDAEGEDTYFVRAENRTLVDISHWKNDRIITWGIKGQPGSQESSAVFVDTQGVSDVRANPFESTVGLLNAASGARGRGDANQTFAGAAGLQGHLLLLAMPRLGLFVGGPGPDSFTAPGRLVIDLGGDDVYLGEVGGGFGNSHDPDSPATDVALAYDLDGDDEYRLRIERPRGSDVRLDANVVERRAYTASAHGAGLLGVGIQIDGGGNNRFTTIIDTGEDAGAQAFGLVQGAAYNGVGILYTAGGKNRYELLVRSELPADQAGPAQGLAQGAVGAGAQGGLGLIISDAPEGNDWYESRVHDSTRSQGSGAGGVLLDRGGDDAYVAEPQAGSQGAASGVLIDLGGRNSFNWAPESSQPLPGTSSDHQLRGCASTGASRISCPVQDNIDRSVTIALDIGGFLESQGLDAPRQDDATGVGLRTEIREASCDAELATRKDEMPAVLGEVCTRVRIVGNLAANEGPPRVDELAFWLETPGEEPEFLGRLPGGDEDHYVFKWNARYRNVSPIFDRAMDDDASLLVTSKAFRNGTQISVEHTCDGSDASPPLVINGLPHGTGSVAIIVDDLDSATPEPAVHWLLWNVPVEPDSRMVEVPAGYPVPGVDDQPFSSAIQGRHSFEPNGLGYRGPCPSPEDTPHTYRFTVYAVHGELDVPEGAERNELERGLLTRTLGRTALSGLFGRAPIHDQTTRLHVVATLPADAAGSAPPRHEPGSPTALRTSTPVHVDSPPRVVVQADPTWVREQSPAATFTVKLLGEAAGDLVEVGLDLVPVDCPGGGCTTHRIIDDGDSRVVDGPISSFEIEFNGEDVDGEPVPPGRYNVVARVTEVLEDAVAWAPRMDVATATFGIDEVAPQGEIILSPFQNVTSTGGAGLVIGWASHDPVGEVAYVNLSGRIGSDGPYQVIQGANQAPPFGNTTWGRFQHGDTISFQLNVTDVAGNEGVVTASTTVDLIPPQLSNPRVDPEFVRSGAPIRFSVNATEDAGITSPRVVIDGTEYTLQQTSGFGAAEKTWVLSYTAWSQVSAGLAAEEGANASRPEGYAYAFVVEDQAGNRAFTSERTLFLDDLPPRVLGATLSYPGGRAAAPGDLVSITVEAADAFGVSRVVANLSALSSAGDLVLTPVPGTRNYTGAFVIDREVPPSGATATVGVFDRAGNSAVQEVPVRVEKTPVGVDHLSVTGIGASNVTVRWSTPRPSAATIVIVSDTGIQEHRFAIPGFVKEHELNVTALGPSTTYHGTLIPLNEAGRGAASRPFRFTTESLINFSVTSPSPRAIMSGVAPLAWSATSPTQTPLAYTIAFVSNQGRIPIASVVGEPGVHRTLAVATDRLPDGVYSLTIEARQGTDEATARVGDILVDNTPPIVRLVKPIPGGATRAGQFIAEAVVADEGSGIDPTRVEFLVDGVSYPPDGLVAGKATVTLNLTSDAHDVAVLASDRAGNRAQDGGPVSVGPLPASVHEARLGDGKRSHSPGSDLPVYIRLQEPSRVTGRLDARAVGVVDAIPLERSGPLLSGTLTLPARVADGRYTVVADLVDAGGDHVRVPLPLRVDGSPPTIESLVVRATGPTTAEVVITSNEPVGAVALLSSPGVAPVQAVVENAAESARIDFDGLVPERSYNVSVEAVDAAGNIATARDTLVMPPDQTPPGPPGVPRAEHRPDGVVVLRWVPASDDAGLTHYRIYRNAPGAAPDLVGAPKDPRFIDETLRAGELAYYSVAAVDIAGNEGPSSPSVPVLAHLAPRLSDGSVTPEKGGTQTIYTFEVTYEGPLDPTPRVEVVLSGVPHRMHRADDDGQEGCTLGCRYTYHTRLPVASFSARVPTHSFQAVAGGFSDNYPRDGSPLTGPLVLALADDDQFLSPDSSWVLGAALAAAALGGALLLGRRRGDSS